MTFSRVVPLPNEEDSVVLLDYASGSSHNLLRMRPDGTTAWRAAGPEASESPDPFVSAFVTSRNVFASSWSCWYCRIYPCTGQILEREFTK